MALVGWTPIVWWQVAARVIGRTAPRSCLLAADPPVILLDEPFGALDPITWREIQQEFRSAANGLRKR
jgi:ABC-type taurine transport system ATPase subunit